MPSRSRGPSLADLAARHPRPHPLLSRAPSPLARHQQPRPDPRRPPDQGGRRRSGTTRFARMPPSGATRTTRVPHPAHFVCCRWRAGCRPGWQRRFDVKGAKKGIITLNIYFLPAGAAGAGAAGAARGPHRPHPGRRSLGPEIRPGRRGDAEAPTLAIRGGAGQRPFAPLPILAVGGGILVVCQPTTDR
jgi:hypothetical protein